VVTPTTLASGFFIPKINPGSAPEEVIGIFTKSVFSHVCYAIFSKDLAWNDRLQQLLRVEKVMNSFLTETSEAMGWNLIEEEILRWQEEHNQEKEEPDQ